MSRRVLERRSQERSRLVWRVSAPLDLGAGSSRRPQPPHDDERIPMIHLDGNSLTLEELASIAVHFAPVSLTDAARTRVRASRAVVDEFADRDAPTYGINTGF